MKYTELDWNLKGIYKILFPNGKIYIGRSNNIKRRVHEHYQKEDGTPCQKALRKYYENYTDIEVEILKIVTNEEELYSLEKEWIAKLNSTKKEVGYNITNGGDGGGSGIHNPSSKFTEEKLIEIIDLLKNRKTNKFIADKFGVHPDTIGKINTGKGYFQEGINYPIRQGKGKRDYCEMPGSLSQEVVDKVLLLLENTDKERYEIMELTGCNINTISKINIGTHPSCQKMNKNFPIRPNRHNIKLTDSELLGIQEDLLEKKLSMVKIGEKFNCSYDLISEINSGKKYFQESFDYPIRRGYPVREPRRK